MIIVKWTIIILCLNLMGYGFVQKVELTMCCVAIDHYSNILTHITVF